MAINNKHGQTLPKNQFFETLNFNLAVSHLIPKGDYGIGPLAPKSHFNTLLVVL
jgi:hypothetical protein